MALIEICSSGHCCNFAGLARRGDPWRWIDFPASFALIKPKSAAPMLFDTGYSRHVLPAMRRFPFWVYRRALPITLGRDAADQLRQRQIEPEQIATIIISHFHPDHIGGLRDFPKARFICSRRAWLDVRGRKGFFALRQGFLADLVPDDFEQRVIFAEDLPPAETQKGAHLLHVGEDRFTLLPLEGHVPGQLGLLTERENGQPLLLAADAAWRNSSLADGIAPHPLAMRVHHDRKAYMETLKMLVEMKKENPALDIVVCHDPGRQS